MRSIFPLGLLLTDDRIWPNSACTRGFKARFALAMHIGSHAAFIAAQVVGLDFRSRVKAKKATEQLAACQRSFEYAQLQAMKHRL